MGTYKLVQQEENDILGRENGVNKGGKSLHEPPV